MIEGSNERLQHLAAALAAIEVPGDAETSPAAKLTLQAPGEMAAGFRAASLEDVLKHSDEFDASGGWIDSYDWPVSEADDLELVERARSGDVHSFAELVRRHERRIGSVLSRLLDDARDVEEALQDTFVQAWRHLDRFRGESALFTWLYRIAVNQALMRVRRKRLPIAELDDDAESWVPRDAVEADPEDVIVDENLRDFLTAKLKELPFEYRAPLVLRDVEGFSNQEVAGMLGISLAAAKSRIHRARMKIRAELEAWERAREQGS